MPLTEDHVREELKKVIDPELFVNIVDLGLIYTVDIKPHSAEAAAGQSSPSQDDSPPTEAAAAEAPAAEAHAAEAPAADTPVSGTAAADDDKLDVFIEMTMTSPMCPAGPQLIGQSKAVVGAMDQVAGVEVKIVLDPPWTPDKMTDDARDQLGIF